VAEEASADRIQITVTTGQAAALIMAADLFTRLSMGQVDELALVIRQGVIPMCSDGGTRRMEPNMDVIAGIDGAVAAIKGLLGYPHGGSHGIGHPHVCIEGRRCYEFKKVVEKALAEHHNPSPKFPGVVYDGLGPRYTNDPAPVAVMLQKQSTKTDNAQQIAHKPARNGRKAGA
jgi:hypothetical protein